jgi:hypothetical protein
VGYRDLMALHAFDDLDDAVTVTKSFLTPIELRGWLKLALVAFFVSISGTGFPGFQGFVGGGGGGGGGPPVDRVPADGFPTIMPGGDVWLLMGAVVAVTVVLGLVFLLVSSVMEFVLLESLRSETVAIRRYWSRWQGKGVRLFAFRLVLGLLVLGAFVLLVGPVVLSALDVGPTLGVSLALLVLLVPAFVLLAFVAGLVNGFTTVFVTPVMLLEDCGVLAGWRRLWPTITAAWKQYLAYAVIGFLLSATGGVLVGLVAVAGVLVLLLPFGLLFALAFGVFLVAEPAGIALFVVVGLLYGLAVLTVVALAQVPVVTYLRYYALLVLGDIEPAFDLVPEQRAAVRDTGADGDVAGAE